MAKLLLFFLEGKAQAAAFCLHINVIDGLMYFILHMDIVICLLAKCSSRV